MQQRATTLPAPLPRASHCHMRPVHRALAHMLPFTCLGEESEARFRSNWLPVLVPRPHAAARAVHQTRVPEACARPGASP
eukprot:4824690-Pleurochrysis_carterae.AAC.1